MRAMRLWGDESLPGVAGKWGTVNLSLIGSTSPTFKLNGYIGGPSHVVASILINSNFIFILKDPNPKMNKVLMFERIARIETVTSVDASSLSLRFTDYVNETIALLRPTHCTRERKVDVEFDMTTVPAFLVVLIVLWLVLKPRRPKPKIN
ncbi:hypothetical protein RHMOL_Rhmol01G0097000 [Rhododendron molle]|uniref:Uncharacterized protein n=1 Tax=Rhododendron molle TaxID=49168 RepID=A0ACC0Q150_RHOML|nr:hypothetical protein RHMOL_Rhmol01G0097000 [Rhododendron molle]